MKFTKPLIFLPLLTSCQWVITHPAEDALLLQEGEQIINRVYEYETGKVIQPATAPKVEVKDAAG